mgnify:CR=1 FL=1
MDTRKEEPKRTKKVKRYPYTCYGYVMDDGSTHWIYYKTSKRFY